jgi:hypothetical protein
MLADQASSAPDYATTGAGWHYPNTRIHYRQRKQSPEVLYVAEGRRLVSQTSIAKLAERIVAAEGPDSVLEKGLIARFLAEIGVTKGAAAQWKASAVGITDALAHELVLPLRALNETIPAMEAKHPGQGPRFEKAVGDITQAVVEGRYREWRYQHDMHRLSRCAGWHKSLRCVRRLQWQQRVPGLRGTGRRQPRLRRMRCVRWRRPRLRRLGPARRPRQRSITHDDHCVGDCGHTAGSRLYLFAHRLERKSKT